MENGVQVIMKIEKEKLESIFRIFMAMWLGRELKES